MYNYSVLYIIVINFSLLLLELVPTICNTKNRKLDTVKHEIFVAVTFCSFSILDFSWEEMFDTW